MGLELLLALGGLALIDSTSIGTIGVPIFLLIARTRIDRIVIYLAAITIFYFAVGLGLLWGLDSVVNAIGDSVTERLGDRGLAIAGLVTGAVLVALSYAFDPKYRKNRPQRTWVPKGESVAAMIALAFSAGIIELATMVPYLSAIGMLVSGDLGLNQQMGLLAAYTLVMVVPALTIIVISRLGGRMVEPWLDRAGRWIQRHADGMLSWALGIVGVIIALNALGALVNTF